MQDAFISNTEPAWELLLELTGAADQADGREGAPCINVQHRATGALLDSVITNGGSFIYVGAEHKLLPMH